MDHAAWGANYSGISNAMVEIILKILRLICIGDRVTITNTTTIKICYIFSRPSHVMERSRRSIGTMIKFR
jgi:hypothetical protein